MTVQKSSWGYIRNTDITGYYTAQELISDFVIAIRYYIQQTYVSLTYSYITNKSWDDKLCYQVTSEYNI